MKLLQSEHGSALVEFSLFLPILILMLMGVVDLGLATEQAMVVTEAAHAGVLYATLPGNNPSTASVQSAMASAANAAAGGMSGFTATAGCFYVCSSTGSKTTSPPSSCSGNVYEYAQMKTSTNFPVLMGYPGLPASFSLSGFSAARVQ